MADIDVNKNLSEQIKLFTVDAIIKSFKLERDLGHQVLMLQLSIQTINATNRIKSF